MSAASDYAATDTVARAIYPGFDDFRPEDKERLREPIQLGLREAVADLNALIDRLNRIIANSEEEWREVWRRRNEWDGDA